MILHSSQQSVSMNFGTSPPPGRASGETCRSVRRGGSDRVLPPPWPAWCSGAWWGVRGASGAGHGPGRKPTASRATACRLPSSAGSSATACRPPARADWTARGSSPSHGGPRLRDLQKCRINPHTHIYAHTHQLIQSVEFNGLAMEHAQTDMEAATDGNVMYFQYEARTRFTLPNTTSVT